MEMQKILIIEENQEEIEFLKVILEEYEVTAVSTAREGFPGRKQESIP